jgi:hypothetical protein
MAELVEKFAIQGGISGRRRGQKLRKEGVSCEVVVTPEKERQEGKVSEKEARI